MFQSPFINKWLERWTDLIHDKGIHRSQMQKTHISPQVIQQGIVIGSGVETHQRTPVCFFKAERITGLREEAEQLYNFTEYSLVGHRPVYGNAWEMSRFLLGMEKTLLMTVKEKILFEAFFDKMSNVLDGFYDVFLNEVGPFIQIIEMAEDLGTNNGPMFNPKFYKEVMWRYHRRTIEKIKKKAPHVKIMLHCDGAIRRFIPDLIDAGFDILNPVESDLIGMDPAELKRDFGKDLVFMGGVDVKKILTKGNRRDIQREIRRRVREMGQGGGYILAPSHNFGNDVPLENLLAFFEEGKRLGIYPIDQE